MQLSKIQLKGASSDKTTRQVNMPYAAVKDDYEGIANSESHDLSKIAQRAKSTTVTMMLAERIVRNDWSLDGEHLVNNGNSPMNLWQTLEFLSGVNIRKRYHYEGYNDTENAVRTLTPSWRRDSFVDKKTEEGSKGATPRPSVVGDIVNDKIVTVPVSVSILSNLPSVIRPKTPQFVEKQKVLKLPSLQNQIKPTKKRVPKKKKKCSTEVEIDPVYNMSPLQYTDIIKCK